MLAFTNVMRKDWLSAVLQPRTLILLGILGLCRPALSQEVSVAMLQPAALQPPGMQPSAPAPSAMAASSPVMAIQPATLPLPEAPGHRFWDRENSFLFAASAAFSTADFVVTRDNLRAGGRELNPITRVFAGSTAAGSELRR